MRFALALLLLTVQAPPDPPKPHIVFLLADDLGWKDVGFHGSEIRTPHLDRLAASGARLNRFYVQPVCSPTRSSLMTGRYPMRYGLQVGVIRPNAAYGLPLDERMLPEALREAGYATAMAGKWHLGSFDEKYWPTRRGFQSHYGHLFGAIDYFSHMRDGKLDWYRDGKPLREEGYSTQLLGREAARIIREHDLSKPLFLYVPFNSTHSPHQAPQDYLDRYKDIADSDRRHKAAMTTCMDDEIGRILGEIEKRGMASRTLILFASDNGGPTGKGASDNGPLRAGKGTLYEGGLRVPACASWAGTIKPGTVIDEAIHIADLYPTFLKLAGASLEQKLPLDGLDAWPAIAQGRPSPREEILHNVEPGRGALRRGPWKIVVQGRLPAADAAAVKVELFNVVEDPSEKNDRSAAQPEKVKDLFERLNAHARAAVPPKSREAADEK
jgi:arylsulfatase A-like enzyme